MNQELWLKLKCVACGHQEKRKASEVIGGDNPACSKCYGPMILTRDEIRLLNESDKRSAI